MTDFSTRERPKDRRADALVLAGGALALALSVAGAVSAYSTMSTARAAAAETRGSVASLRERIRAQEQSRASSEEQRLASRVVLGARSPVTAAVAALERVLPADVRLESLAVSYEEACQVELRVEARRPAAYDEFLSRLFASPYFEQVAPGAEIRGDTVSATVRARFRGVAR